MDDVSIKDRLSESEHPRLLLQAREASGLQLDALAAVLKVPVRKLEALESGRYEDLPDLTFARALASSACRHLKVDPAPILSQIPVTFSPSSGDPLQTLKGRTKISGDISPPSFFARARLSLPWLILTLSLLALALYILPANLLVLSKTTTVLPLVATTPREIEESNKSAAPVKLNLSEFADRTGTQSYSESFGTTASDAAITAAPLVAATDDVPNSPSSTASLPVAAPESSAVSYGGDGVINLVASGDSWVEVANGRGQVLLRRMLKAGERVDLSSVPPYAVVIGRADMVQVMLRGQQLDIAPYARNSVARFEVK